MNRLLQILKEDEKKIDILTARHAILKKNIANETKADKEARTELGGLISTMKKSNAVIVEHCLGEHILAAAEIEKIVSTHTEK